MLTLLLQYPNDMCNLCLHGAWYKMITWAPLMNAAIEDTDKWSFAS